MGAFAGIRVGARAPAYFDALVAAERAGVGAPDHVHLGHWDDPPPLDRPVRPGEFEAAQARLSAILLDLLEVRPGERVLDVGCGFGGTAAMLRVRVPGADVIGLNVDRRQLGVARTRVAGAAWVAADACRLPLADGSVARVLCVEAMFHFASRAAFLAEAARVLSPGGRLVASDILLTDPGRHGPAAPERIAAALREGYGPWPEPWCGVEAVEAAARAAGLAVAARIDATAATLPSYRVTAPRPLGARHPDLAAGPLLRWLQSRGFATYAYLAFDKPGAS